MHPYLNLHLSILQLDSKLIIGAWLDTIWLGGYRSGLKWAWQMNEITYEKWLIGQPDGDGACMEERASFNFLWNDLPCSTYNNLVCELLI